LLLSSARQYLQSGELSSALATADTAARLRADDDTWRLRALVQLLSRNFAGALAAYCQVRCETGGDAEQNGIRSSGST
jgi:hypothetical protein